MLFPLIIILISVILCIRSAYPLGLVSLITLAALITYDVFCCANNLAELASQTISPALITIVCMMVLGHSLTENGVTNYLAVVWKNGKIRHPQLWTLVIACLASAFMNNTTIVTIFIPIMHKIAKQLHISDSKLMMPLAFASSMGGMLTVIGSSTNLLIQSTLETLGYQLRIFDFLIPGAFVASIGMLYVIWLLPKILGDRYKTNPKCKKFITKISIEEHSEFCDQPLTTLIASHREMIVLEIERNGAALDLSKSLTLKREDVLTVALDYQNLSECIENKLLKITPNHRWQNHKEKNLVMVEGIVKRNSNLIGQSINEVHLQGNVAVIATEFDSHSTVIKNGISVLILLERSRLENKALEEEVVLLEPTLSKLHSGRKTWQATLIFSGVIAAAAIFKVPIMVASLLGVALSLVVGCIRFCSLKHYIESSVVITIMAANLIAYTLNKNGTLDVLSHFLVSQSQSLHPIAAMCVLFLTISILNEMISNNTVGILFAPLALDMSYHMGVDPRLFTWCVIFASGCAFSTPIGYQTNLMVMSPGKYVFTDYLKGGIPLTILVMIAYAVFCSVYFF